MPRWWVGLVCARTGVWWIHFDSRGFPFILTQTQTQGFGGNRMSPWVARLEGKLAAEFRATPAGQFAMRLYAEGASV